MPEAIVKVTRHSSPPPPNEAIVKMTAPLTTTSHPFKMHESIVKVTVQTSVSFIQSALPKTISEIIRSEDCIWLSSFTFSHSMMLQPHETILKMSY
jgi:hypothetical protein